MGDVIENENMARELSKAARRNRVRRAARKRNRRRAGYRRKGSW